MARTSMTVDILAGLNPAQEQAVTLAHGPALVLAGPGSGKTRVLAHRVAYLIQSAGVSPYGIMAVTFTNKAAQEMRERIDRLVGRAIPSSTGWRGLTIGTFHSICARMLRQEADAVGLSATYVIFDDGEQLTAVRQALRDLKLDDKLYRPEAMRGAISQAKNELIDAEVYPATTYYGEVIRRVYGRYQEVMRANNALDFDDLLMRAVFLFRDRPEVLRRYQERYEHVLVDEFQDTNTAQYELVRLLSARSRNLFAVGDEDQSIYGFRGADYRNVQRFRDDYPDAEVVLLEENYRSTQQILEAANAIIARNIHRTPKRLRASRGRGLHVVVHEAYNEADEAAYVADMLQRLVSSGEARLGECAVMYRTNAQSRPLEDALVMRGIPYQLVGGTRFYQRKEIKDALALLRVVHNPADNISLQRIINEPPRGIGEKTVATLASWCTLLDVPMTTGLALVAGDLQGPLMNAAMRQFDGPTQHPFGAAAQKALLRLYKLLAGWVTARDGLTVAALLDHVTEESGYAAWLRDGTEEGEDRWSNLQELRSVATNYDSFPPELQLSAFLEEVALVSDQDDLAEPKDRATLLTLHSAKGLEFPVVFMVGLEENVLPHSRSMENPDQMEEERRLMYVGVTRAKDRLFLIHAFRRMLYGRSEVNEPSRFLRDAVVGGALTSSPGPGNGRQRSQGLGNPPGLRSGRTGEARTGFDRSPLSAERGPAEWPPPGARQAPGRAEKPEERATRFQMGDRVEHAVFGQGIVVSSVLTAGDEEVTVTFAGKGTKTLLASFAKLSKTE